MSEFEIVPFNAIKHMWESPEMWGTDPYKPVSSMLYYDGKEHMGGNDLSVYGNKLSQPYFLVYKQQGFICGVVSWFWIQNTARLRGLYVKPEYRGQGISEKLLRKALNYSRLGWSAFGEPLPLPDFAWALAGPNSMHVHEKVGFRKVTQQMHHMPDGNVSKHENCYMRYDYD